MRDSIGEKLRVNQAVTVSATILLHLTIGESKYS